MSRTPRAPTHERQNGYMHGLVALPPRDLARTAHPAFVLRGEPWFAPGMSALTRSPAWQALLAHHSSLAATTMRELFAADPQRFARMSCEVCGLLIDWSKHRATDETWRLLIALAEQADVAGWRDRMFSGDKINVTEGRAVLHVALRNRSNRPIRADGVDVMPRSTRCWPGCATSPSACAAARGRATPGSRSPTSSTSGSAARISGR